MLTSLTVLGALVVATSSYAAIGTVTMGWTGCNASPITDLAVTAGQATGIQLVTFVTGMDVPTTAYQVEILYGDATLHTPDAWRFDPTGCQGSAFVTLQHSPPAALSKTCPSFQDAGGNQQSLQIQDLSANIKSPYATTLMRFTMANSYPSGPGNVPVAATKYFLAGLLFDETFGSVGPTPPGNPPASCGNIETPICFNLNYATYLDLQGAELPFTFHGGATGDWITANAFGAGCQNTPAVTRTWGAIKSQYRN